jgi:hypothetical protein
MHSATWASVVANYSAVFTSGFGVAKSVGSKAAIGRWSGRTIAVATLTTFCTHTTIGAIALPAQSCAF